MENDQNRVNDKEKGHIDDYRCTSSNERRRLLKHRLSPKKLKTVSVSIVNFTFTKNYD